MKLKIIIYVATLALTTTAYSQSAKPAMEPSITETIITPVIQPTEAKATTNTSFTKPNIEVQLKPVKPATTPTAIQTAPQEKIEPGVLSIVNTAVIPITTIDTKIDDSNYYKRDNNLKPKYIDTVKPAEVIKTTLPKPSAKTNE